MPSHAISDITITCRKLSCNCMYYLHPELEIYRIIGTGMWVLYKTSELIIST